MFQMATHMAEAIKKRENFKQWQIRLQVVQAQHLSQHPLYPHYTLQKAKNTPLTPAYVPLNPTFSRWRRRNFCQCV